MLALQLKDNGNVLHGHSGNKAGEILNPTKSDRFSP